MMRFKKQDYGEEAENKRASSGQLQFKNELLELCVIPQCKTQMDKDNIMNFKATYTPEEDSLWYPGVYQFDITIPDTYSIDPPKVMCETKIYHPNIDLWGNVCLNILKEDWKPTLSISAVLAGIYYLFTDPNPNDPLNHGKYLF